MNTLNKDRNILKRLVESYGKKDVLNFVRHLNENTNELTEEEKTAILSSIDFYVFQSGGSSYAAEDDEYGIFDDAEIKNNKLILYIDGIGYDLIYDIDEAPNFEYTYCIIRFIQSSPKYKAIVKNIIDRVTDIEAVVEVRWSNYAKQSSYYKDKANLPNEYYSLGSIKVLDCSYDDIDNEGNYENNPSIDVELHDYAAGKYDTF